MGGSRATSAGTEKCTTSTTSPTGLSWVGAVGGTLNGNWNFSNNSASPMNVNDGYGNAWLGNFNNYSEGSRNFSEWWFWQVEFFAQDSWRVNRRLTVNGNLVTGEAWLGQSSPVGAPSFFPSSPSAQAPTTAPLTALAGCVGFAAPAISLIPRTGRIARKRTPRRSIPG